MLNFTLVKPDNAAAWDSFISEKGTLYHSSAWARVIERTYGYPVHFLVALDGDGRVVAGIPFCTVRSLLTGSRMTSLPCAQSCGPVGSQDAIIPLISEFIKINYENKCSTIEIRSENDLPLSGIPKFKCKKNYVTHVLDLSNNADDAWKGFHKSCIQRVIRKAERLNIKVELGTEEKDLVDFYILYLRFRKYNGLLPQPYRYFASMRKELEPQGSFHLLLAKHKGKTVSGVLLVSDSTTMIYEYGASVEGMQHLGGSPLLIWHGIQMAVNRSAKKFDLGRSSVSNENLRLFKSRWGAREQQLRYYYHSKLPGFSTARENSLFSTLMSLVIKSSPPSVCRLLGSILYRHFI